MAEMVRINKTQKDLANLLSLNKTTISDKMNGKKDFWLRECKEIIKAFFPGQSIEYLFKYKKKEE